MIERHDFVANKQSDFDGRAATHSSDLNPPRRTSSVFLLVQMRAVG
jgi:hypothetical protein